MDLKRWTAPRRGGSEAAWLDFPGPDRSPPGKFDAKRPGQDNHLGQVNHSLRLRHSSNRFSARWNRRVCTLSIWMAIRGNS